MTAKTNTKRVSNLRKRREAAGVKRLELYAHENDHAQIKALANKLAQKRSKAINPA